MSCIIALSADFSREPRRRLALGEDYMRAVMLAGGLPLIAGPGFGEMDADALAEQVCLACCGVLLTGGGDIDPAYYGEEPHPSLGIIQPERDEFEISLARAAVSLRIPLMAICRGMQVLNVAMGGSLFQDIPSQIPYALIHSHQTPRWQPVHEVSIAHGSIVGNIIGEDRARVNSFHHQAVKDLAPGFTATAWAPDGVIEAMEKRDTGFILAVQWHPEGMVSTSPEMLRVFRAFVAAAMEKE